MYKRYENELNFHGILFPVAPNKIGKFEKQNDVSVNLYILQKYGNTYKVSPCHVTSLKKQKHVNLLLMQDHYVVENEPHVDDNLDVDDSRDGIEDTFPKYHYVWVKNLSRLVRSQLTNHRAKCYICDICLHFFVTEDKLRKHPIDCTHLNKCKIQLPFK